MPLRSMDQHRGGGKDQDRGHKREGVMKFMASWSIQQCKWLPLCKRWGSMSPQERADAGERGRIVGRWNDVAARTGVAIFESDDLAAVQRYVGQWNAPTWT